MDGSCLCGTVLFEIVGKTTDIYQCHCSICRKATGSAGTSVFLCRGASFHWLSGESNVQRYITPSGYRSVFCRICGSRLPDPNPDKSTYWIPAGLINEGLAETKVGAHIYVGSKAAWDQIADDGIQYDAHFPT